MVKEQLIESQTDSRWWSLEVDSDQFLACLVHSEQYVGRMDGMGQGWVKMVIIGRRQSKSIFGANNITWGASVSERSLINRKMLYIILRKCSNKTRLTYKIMDQPTDPSRPIWPSFIYITVRSGQKRAVRSKGGRRVQRERQHQQQPGSTKFHIYI